MVDETPTPHKSASSLSVGSFERLKEIKSRKVSAASTVSASSGVSECLNYKIKDVELDIDYAERCKKGLEKLKRKRVLRKRSF